MLRETSTAAIAGPRSVFFLQSSSYTDFSIQCSSYTDFSISDFLSGTFFQTADGKFAVYVLKTHPRFFTPAIFLSSYERQTPWFRSVPCTSLGFSIRRAHKERGWYATHNISLASCPSGRRSDWAVRRFDLLVLSEVPDVALSLCAQGEGAFLRIAP